MPPFGVLGALRGPRPAPSGFYDGVRRMGPQANAVRRRRAAWGWRWCSSRAAWRAHDGKAAARGVDAVRRRGRPLRPPPRAARAAAPVPPRRRRRPAAEANTAEAEEPDRSASRRAPTKAGGVAQETARRTKAARRQRRRAAASADNKKMLEDGERLLRAERFGEARAVFEKLAKSKRDRARRWSAWPRSPSRRRTTARPCGRPTGGRVRRRREGPRPARRRALPAGPLQGSGQGLRGGAEARSEQPSAKSGLALANKRM